MTLLSNKRHTLAHLLAQAVREQYPNAQLTLGPAIDTGFYYDIDFGTEKISNTDLPKLEKSMRKHLSSWKEFSSREVTKDEALQEFSSASGVNPYKAELIGEIEDRGEKITLYTCGGFTDLCRGGHVENSAEEIALDSFALDRVAGAYWRGDEKNPMLTRIYGLAFDTKEELDAYITQREEAKKRDHRKIGKELGLFSFSDLVGAGLPLFSPKGTIVREELARFSEELQRAKGFEKVWIPHITKIDLYKKSGHWEKFGNELFLVTSQESSDQFALKPMNCPHHTQIFASEPRSYRDLPIRYMDTTTCYRDEKTGELSGLTRVRSLTQDDGHIFCTMEQVEQEFENIMNMIKTLYRALGMNFKARLSFSDPSKPENYLGDRSVWEKAESIIETVAKKLGLDYSIAPGEAAFYGPKIDIMVIDALGREWQCATEQLDFVQPTRFGLEYTAENGSKQTPVMIHKALLGTIDRFLGVYIEHTMGAFPLWMSPVQARVVPVSEKHVEYAKEILSTLKATSIRADVDAANESLGKKIRNAKTEKVPYLLVVGDKEVEAGTISVDSRDHGKLNTMSVADFINRASEEIRTRK